jgi:hypothetical protein
MPGQTRGKLNLWSGPERLIFAFDAVIIGGLGSLFGARCPVASLPLFLRVWVLAALRLDSPWAHRPSDHSRRPSPGIVPDARKDGEP